MIAAIIALQVITALLLVGIALKLWLLRRVLAALSCKVDSRATDLQCNLVDCGTELGGLSTRLDAAIERLPVKRNRKQKGSQTS